MRGERRPWLAPYDLDSLDNRDEPTIARWVRRLEPWLERYFRAEVRGLPRVPPGPALLVGNHNGASVSVDTFLLACTLYRHGGMDAFPYVLGHDLWRLPGLDRLLGPFGVLRASHDNAERALARGAKVLVYPGGDLEVMRAFRDRDRIVFDGRTGYVRLALRAGVPIVPVVAAGAHATLLVLDDGRWLASRLGVDRRFRTRAWPIALSVPWGLTIGPPPPYLPWPSAVWIEVLDPIGLEPRGSEAAQDEAYVRACADRVEDTMQRALTRLAAERRAARRR